MDLFDVVRSCIRRWYVVLPLLAIAAWYGHQIYASVKPVYYCNAAISLAPPSTHVDNAAVGAAVSRNGLLDVGGATLIANLTAMSLNDPSVGARVVAAGGTADYYAKMFPTPPPGPQLPLIMIESSSLPDPVAATKTVELAVAQAEPTLQTLQQQANVPPDQMVTPFIVSPPSVPVAGMPSRTRSTIAIVAAGAGIAIVVGVVVDVLLLRWKARRQKRRQARVQTQNESDTVAGSDTPDGASNVRLRNRHAVGDEVAMDKR